MSGDGSIPLGHCWSKRMCLVAGVCGWEYTRTCGLKNSAGRQRTAEGEKKRRRAANESQVQGTRMRWKSGCLTSNPARSTSPCGWKRPRRTNRGRNMKEAPWDARSQSSYCGCGAASWWSWRERSNMAGAQLCGRVFWQEDSGSGMASQPTFLPSLPAALVLGNCRL